MIIKRILYSNFQIHQSFNARLELSKINYTFEQSQISKRFFFKINLSPEKEFMLNKKFYVVWKENLYLEL